MYEPQVNDYVKWTTALGMVHEGGFISKQAHQRKKRGGKNQVDIFQSRLQQNQDHSVI